MSVPWLSAAALWQSLLAIAGFVFVIGGIIAVQLASERRRRREEEATAYNAEGAEAMIHRPLL